MYITGGKFSAAGYIYAFTKENETIVEITGGIYDHEITASYCTSESCAVVANTDEATKTAYPYTVKQYVAQIGDVKYETIQAAVDAASTTEQTTITILTDLTYDKPTSPILKNGTTLKTGEKTGKNLVLDLNGKTITAEVDDTLTSGESSASGLAACACMDLIANYNGGTLLVTGNGKITLDCQTNYGWNKACTIFANTGTLVIENGTFENKGTTSMSYVIDNRTRNCLGNATVTIVDGTFKCPTYTDVRLFAETDTNIVTVVGGTFTGKRCFYSQQNVAGCTAGAEINIADGSFTASQRVFQFDVSGVVTKSPVNITGGTFSCGDNAENAIFHLDTVYEKTSPLANSAKAYVSGGKFAWGAGNLFDPEVATLGGELKGGVYDQSPAAAYVPNGYAVVANADAAYPYTVGVKVDVGGTTDATAVTDEQSSSVDTEKLASVVTEEDYRVKIPQKTEVVGVVLTTEAETNAQGIVITPAGVQAVVDNAIETGDAEFTNALANASVVTVKVDVVVTPLSFVATNAQMTTGSISFDLKPRATVTVAKDGVAYSNIVDVTNEMIDQTRNILVSIYTGFQPQQITHWAATNDLIETFTPEQIAFADGVSTVKISHFSYLNANAVAQVAYVNGVGYTNLTQAVNAMKDGDTLQLFDTTQTPVAPNGYHFDVDESGNYYTLVKNTLVEVEWESVKINNIVTNKTYLAAESQSISLPAAWGETVVGDVTITIKDADGNVIATQTVAGTETSWSFTTVPWAPGSYTVTMSWSGSTGSETAEAKTDEVSYVVEVLAWDEWGTLDIDNRIQNNTTRLADGTEVITLPASWNGAAGGTVVLHITDPDGAETTQTFTENETSWSWETAPLMPGTYQMSLTGDNVESDATNVTYVIEATAFDSAIGGAIDNYYEDDTNNVRLASTHSLDFNLKWVGATNTVLTLDGAVVKATPDANGMWTWNTNDLMGAIYTFTNVVDGVAYEAKFQIDSDLIKAIVDNGLIVRMTVAEYEGMFGTITNRSEAAIAAPLMKKTNSDTAVWQNYILLGTADGCYNTPTNMLEAMAARVDTTALEKMETTVQPIRIKARHIPESAPAITTAGVTVTYSLMASTDNVNWTAISEGKAKPEFDIDLEDRDDFTYWKIQAVFSGDKK